MNVTTCICFEGVDFVGKTTLAERFHNENSGSVLQRFPDRSTPTGKHIDKMLRGEVDGADGFEMQVYQFVNRLEVASDLESVTDGYIFLDRYWPSGFAYGLSDGLDPKWLLDCSLALRFQPDVFVLLTFPVEEIQARAAKSDKHREIYDDAEKLAEAQRNYLKLWLKMAGRNVGVIPGQRWCVVDLTGKESKDEVYQRVKELVNPSLASRMAGEFWTGP